jgi:hypothetical protein
VCKFLAALKNGGEASMPSSDAVVINIANEQGKMVAKAKERNSLAMDNLTVAFETENLFGLIYKTMSTDWPGGLAHEVVVQLFNKYSPDDRISRVELRSMLNGVSMKNSEDPSVLFEQVSAIQNRYDTDVHHIDEEELIAVVMGAAPEKYLSVITCEQRVKGNLMSLYDLEVVMYQLWRQTKGSMDQNTTEITLAAFDGYCYQCKQKGHKADACPNHGSKKKDGSRAPNTTGRGGRGGRGNGRDGAQFQGTCRNCGKQGHKESSCWQKEENAGLRPSGY